MLYECHGDASPSKSQFINVSYYKSRYGLQHGALAHTKQQASKGPKVTSVKLLKQEKQRAILYHKDD